MARSISLVSSSWLDRTLSSSSAACNIAVISSTCSDLERASSSADAAFALAARRASSRGTGASPVPRKLRQTASCSMSIEPRASVQAAQCDCGAPSGLAASARRQATPTLRFCAPRVSDRGIAAFGHDLSSRYSVTALRCSVRFGLCRSLPEPWTGRLSSQAGDFTEPCAGLCRPASAAATAAGCSTLNLWLNVNLVCRDRARAVVFGQDL